MFSSVDGVEGVGDSSDVVAAVEGIESKTGGDEGSSPPPGYYPVRHNMFRRHHPLARLKIPNVELEVIDFPTGDRRPVGREKNLSRVMIRVDFSTEEVHKARYMEPRFQQRSKYKI